MDSCPDSRSVVCRRSLLVALMAMGLLMLALTGLSTVVAGPTDPTSQRSATTPVTQPEWVSTPMRVLDLPGADSFFSTSTRAVIDTISVVAEKALPPLMKAQEACDVSIDGGLIFVYPEMRMDGTPFKLEIGAPVIGTPKAVQGYAVRKLEGIHAATTVYSGAAKYLSAAYGDLYDEIRQAGLIPSGETRETYLHWESPDSPNNIVLIAIKVR